MVLGRAASDDVLMAIRRSLVPWIVYAATIASALPLAALIAWATPMPSGACSGIGFGCSLYEWDAAAFMLIFLGVPYAVIVGLVLAVLSLTKLIRAAEVVAWLGLAIPWMAVLFGVITSDL